MYPKNDPTYIGWNEKLGMWGFSASPMSGVDKLWSVSHWSWDDIAEFMNALSEDERWVELTDCAYEVEVPSGA